MMNFSCASQFAYLGFIASAVIACNSPSKEQAPAAPAPTEIGMIAAPELSDARDLRRMVQSPRGDTSRMVRLLAGNLEERRWATLGLGSQCLSDPESILRQLVSAASLWTAAESPPDVAQLKSIGWAIGSCGSKEAEEILRTWLAPDPTAQLEGLIDAGALGLGALADRGQKLSERTQTAVLDAAGREKRAELLLPLARVGRLSEAVGAHLLEVVGALLTQKRTEGRREAIFSLGNAGPSAVDPLAQILLAKTYDPRERAAAAQALGRLGLAGQKALDKTIAELLERGLPVEFDRPLWIPLRSALEVLQEPARSRPFLDKIGEVVLSEGEERDKSAQRKRMVWLRCRAADLLAGDSFDSRALEKCDPKRGATYQLAQLKALARAPIKGQRLKRYREILKSKNPAVSQAALRLVPSHPEIEEAPALLLQALTSQITGNKTTAAQIIFAYPSRAFEGSAEGPSDALQKALGDILAPEAKLPTETKAAALNAAGALGALTLKARVEENCDGADSGLWAPAERSLSLLGSPKRTCPKKQPAPPSVPDPLRIEPATLVIDSDVGELLLHVEPAAAPLSSAHFLGLVDAGFYNGLTIHGARPGFAVQFGDKNGDGYDDRPDPGLPNEISPEPFQAHHFGLSSFAPGKQDSEVFVVVSDAPQLTGNKIRLGRAEGPWHLLMVGDTLHSVKRK